MTVIEIALHLSPRAGRGRNRRAAEVSGEGESPRIESELDPDISSNPIQRSRGDAVPCPSPGILASLNADLPRRRGEVIWIAVPSDLNINSHNYPRGAILRPSDASNVAPSKQRAQGMPGAGRTRRPCGLKRKDAHKSVQVGRNDPALPAQWLYGLLRALLGVPGFLAPVVCSLGRLDPSIGGSGPHGLTVRDAPHALRHHRVHRIPRHVSWRSRNALRSERGTASFNHNFCVSERLIF